MSKVKSIIVLFLTVALIGGLGFIAVFGVGENKTGAASKIKRGLDLEGGVSITFGVVGETPAATDLNDTVFKLKQRVDRIDTEAQVYPEGNDRINVEIPGADNAEEILEELGRPGSLYFIRHYAPDNTTSNYSYDSASGMYVLARDLDEIIADGSAILSGTDVKSATARTSKNDYSQVEYVVELVFTPEGAKIFAEETTAAYERGRDSIAIYYDGELISVPNVQNPITSGTGIISGQASMEEAEKLASNIRIGGLSLELEELQSKVVGAQLGMDAIDTSVKAGIIGLIIVMIFMIAVYWIPGVASALALAIYTILVLLTMNAFELTLTLPGIAGIILSIGMAVDANVIIFARIREELGTGKTVRSAIDIGFKKALSAILDGNITTLIAAFVLIWFGTGSVKGFAITLAIGIVLSMFTALVITRLILKALYGIGLRSEKLYGATKEHKTVDFLKRKALFFSVSAALIVAGIVGMIAFKAQGKGSLNYGLEFAGGTTITVPMNEEYTLERVNKEIVPEVEKVIGSGDIQTQTVKGTTDVIIKTRTLNSDERTELETVLRDTFDIPEDKEIGQDTIGATISNEMRRNAVISVAIATLCMLLYIFIRFRDFRFATSAVVALLHDVLVVLAFYALFRVSVGNTFIACMLTIVGYSINATIVIFDRIRENMKSMTKKDDLKEVVNKSITQTLTRSIYTSFTTFVMVLVLFIMGVNSIRLFALPLMVGIVCGAYSSVCITGALWYVMKKRIGAGKTK